MTLMTNQDLIIENNRLRKKIAEMQQEVGELHSHSADFIDRINYLDDENERLLETNAELKSEIEELELELSAKESLLEIVSANHESGLPREPISVAEMLINAEMESEIRHYGLCCGDTALKKSKSYDVSELRQIAEHLLVYCKANEIEDDE